MTLLAPAASATGGGSLQLSVYANGYVQVSQVLPVDSRATSVEVTLLSGVVSNLVATDQNGSPLSYSFNSGGANVTVYTLGAASVTLRYDTNALTSKNGTVWTLAYSARYNSTVVLPQFATLISVLGTPYSINQTDTSPEVALSPGAWRLSYGVPLGTMTSASTGTQAGPTPPAPGTQASALELGVAIAMVAAAGASFVWWRRRGIGPVSRDLRPDDVQVLNFIQEKGGRVLELEIRARFALPKTSAWRQIKRLERLGYVKVTKTGTQNQIEIIKEREA